MFTLGGRALSFAQARAMEKKYVDDAQADGDPDRYMRQVARGVAHAVRSLALARCRMGVGIHLGTDEANDGGNADRLSHVPGGVAAFVGGGEGGGDALYACALLARRGIGATAFLLKHRCHERALAAAREAGVRIVDMRGRSLRAIEGESEWVGIRRAAAWIDGIVGIGARGPLTGQVADSVEHLNELSRERMRPIVAIDVPSGLTDDEGQVQGPIVRATHTLAVGAYKRAQILPPAAAFCGETSLISMDWESSDPSERGGDGGAMGAGDLYRYDGEALAGSAVPVPGFADDKYARGVVGLVAGSDTYPGAGLLATRGALAAGVGMVRLNSTRRVRDLVLTDQPGVVTVGGRIQAALIGPGLDEERREDALELARFCGQASMPLVIDAGALDLLLELADAITPEETVLTPHYGEAARLLGLLGAPVTRTEVAAHPLRYARALHEATGCHVVLKGPVTIVYSFRDVDRAREEAPGRAPGDGRGDGERPAAGDFCRVCEPAVTGPTTSWASVAGSGDVLAGLIAGVLARPVADAQSRWGMGGNPQRVTPARLCAPVWLHARAAAVSAERYAGRAPIQARDIADAIPAVLSGRALTRPSADR